MNRFLILGAVLATAGMGISAGLDMPQHGLCVFLAGFIVMVAASVARQFARSKKQGAGRALAWSGAGFLVVAIASVGEAAGVFSETVSLVATSLGGAVMLLGIIVHLRAAAASKR